MHNLTFRLFSRLRASYWFWPSVMTILAIILGFVLPILDGYIGTSWTKSIIFIHPSAAEGARAILTTLASAILGVGGVVFSITIVAVSYASSNYGPRLIGNFMADRVNQLVLGAFVATFAYCVSVLTTVRSQATLGAIDIEPFVPQTAVGMALLFALVCIAALIVYIHHIPESINIMNLMEKVGSQLEGSIATMLAEEDRRDREGADRIDVASWKTAGAGEPAVLRARCTGFLQQFDLTQLDAIAQEKDVQVTLERGPGDFVAAQEALMSVRPASRADEALFDSLEACYTLGRGRTSVQDILFLSDQLVEVLMRALSPSVNDPHTAMLCIDWLRAGLSAFALREPSQPTGPGERVRYRRVTFTRMLDRSFDRMRQSVCTERTVTIYAITALADIGIVATRQEMTDACIRQMRHFAQSALEVQKESLAHGEIEDALSQGLRRLAARHSGEMGESTLRSV